jgi:hypothetical protein
MSYRHRMQVKMERRAQHTKQEREDRILYVEPHLRDYEAAFFEANNFAVTCEYKGGWVYVANGSRPLSKVRLNQLISMTGTLQARVHERSITNGGTNGA